MSMGPVNKDVGHLLNLRDHNSTDPIPIPKQVMTSSGDGMVKVDSICRLQSFNLCFQWWDIRSFKEAVSTVILDPDNEDPEAQGDVNNAFRPSTLEYDPTIPARYKIHLISKLRKISTFIT